MKKFGVVFSWMLVVFAGSRLFAGGLSDEKSKTWRSTEICGTLLDNAISTAPAYLYKIQVTSGSGDGLSQFEYVNSSAAISDQGAIRSTSTVYDVDTSGNGWEIRRPFSRGLRGRKTGTACISCLWDFLIFTPPGQADAGYMD